MLESQVFGAQVASVYYSSDMYRYRLFCTSFSHMRRVPYYSDPKVNSQFRLPTVLCRCLRTHSKCQCKQCSLPTCRPRAQLRCYRSLLYTRHYHLFYRILWPWTELRFWSRVSSWVCSVCSGRKKLSLRSHTTPAARRLSELSWNTSWETLSCLLQTCRQQQLKLGSIYVPVLNALGRT